MRIVPALIALGLLHTSLAAAAGLGESAKLYRIDGRPVPVSCLEGLTGAEEDARSKPIDLRTCGNTKLRPKTQADGTIGYDSPDGGYFYYAYLGRSGGMDILSLQSSGGGSGRFTQLVGVKHQGRLVRLVKTIAGGDRCNGGIAGEKITGGILAFDQAITPYDLIQLAPPKRVLEAYRDLENSAASCVGFVHKVGVEPRWISVAPGGALVEDRNWTEQYRYQACFNGLYHAAIARHRTRWSRQDVAELSQRFESRCL